MLRAILNKSRRKHLTKKKLYGYLPPVTKTIQVRRTRHAEHYCRCREELISDELVWIPLYGREKAERPAGTYIQQLCADRGYSPEDLSEDRWRERVYDIRADGATWWWWCISNITSWRKQRCFFTLRRKEYQLVLVSNIRNEQDLRN